MLQLPQHSEVIMKTDQRATNRAGKCYTVPADAAAQPPWTGSTHTVSNRRLATSRQATFCQESQLHPLARWEGFLGPQDLTAQPSHVLLQCHCS